MNYSTLGRTGLEVSSLGMGCVTFGREIDEAASFAVLDHAFEQGITLFDTAAAYADGASEQVLGNWLSSRKLYDKIVLASKVTTPLTAKHVVESAEASLKRLRTETIDLFQLHTWDDDVPLDETLAALTQLQQAGKVRFIGCSNFSAWQLAKALLATHESGFARIESVQPPYNLVQREIEPDLLPLCLDQQVGVMSYSPLGAGFLTGKYHRGGPVPKGTRFDVIPGHQPIYFTEEGWRIVEGLRTLAESSGQAMIPLALSWVANRPGVTSVLVGGRTPEHIDQAISARQAPLSDDLLEAIERLLSSGT